MRRDEAPPLSIRNADQIQTLEINIVSKDELRQFELGRERFLAMTFKTGKKNFRTVYDFEASVITD